MSVLYYILMQQGLPSVQLVVLVTEGPAACQRKEYDRPFIQHCWSSLFDGRISEALILRLEAVSNKAAGFQGFFLVPTWQDSLAGCACELEG